MAVTAGWEQFFKERHPVAAVTGVDPLDSLGRALPRSGDTPRGSEHLRLGYACIWEPVAEHTWSGSASGLRQGLETAAETVDLGVRFPALTRTALKAIHTHYRSGRLTTSWSYSSLTAAYIAHSVETSLRRNRSKRPLDAVLTIDTIATVPEPFFAYYDSSWDALMSGAASLRQFAKMRLLTPSEVLRQRDQQLVRFEHATGIITMSHWLARSLVEQSGVPADKIHVVPPGRPNRRAQPIGVTSSPSGNRAGAREAQRRRSESGQRRRSLLFVGRLYEPHDFYRKGGDIVVDALRILRHEFDPQITLTMVGIDKWPISGDIPEGIHLRGVVPYSQVRELYETHDLFVMPSRMEPFGLVFTEALCQGMPCVARNACAMPEIVTPGVSGALVSSDDPSELANTIVSVLADDDLYERCRGRAAALAEYFSWDRAACEIADLINRQVR